MQRHRFKEHFHRNESGTHFHRIDIELTDYFTVMKSIYGPFHRNEIDLTDFSPE